MVGRIWPVELFDLCFVPSIDHCSCLRSAAASRKRRPDRSGEDRMAATAADRMVESLPEWGVDIVFGLPGDGINGIMEALRQRQDRIRFVQVRHEETAALMACGYAKLTG